MAATETVIRATRLPGPPELLPGCPDAVVDLQTEAGAGLVGGQWRYSDCSVEEIEFVELGAPDDPLGPGERPNRTYDVLPHAAPSERAARDPARRFRSPSSGSTARSPPLRATTSGCGRRRSTSTPPNRPRRPGKRRWRSTGPTPGSPSSFPPKPASSVSPAAS